MDKWELGCSNIYFEIGPLICIQNVLILIEKFVKDSFKTLINH